MPAVRAIFISDVHLGTRACQAESLLGFLREHESEYLYLLGDIIDFWAMNRSVQWAGAHNTVVQKVLRRARHGCQVFFIPGNHDEALREYAGIAFGDIRVESEWIHETLDGRRYWLVHGDEYDQVTRHHRWVAVLGDVGYNALVRINLVLSRVRRALRRPGYWSLAGYAKQKVKKAVSFIFDFEDAVAHAAQQRGVDGVVCGHIHWAADRRIGKVRYLNCGDWVDTCSAIVEHYDGRIEVVHWGVHGAAVGKVLPAQAVSAALAQPEDGSAHQPARTARMQDERIYLTPDL
ncbi:UDP-2,3-diacylglucosamine hydrolase [Thauera sp. GDN1]|uniref:UDP-2,3-diacylglucosamine diphosphatase n=1 Tax=Thauera sp. GDN1 TaxID=2944810 RepID=UPI00247925C9|nr:UDP-2,3-diacylglucosamine diphosphatase [Thauera sp. GDN1]WEN41911.1 UDP-2,3-diacylglucosamine hydrolase [Thauera sp. GDN1]